MTPLELETGTNRQRWPMRWCLCLAHRRELTKGLPTLGVLLEERPIVYLGEMEQILDHIRDGQMVGSRAYESWEALFSDWRID